MSPNNYQTRLPLPWLTSPAPKSLIQPDISVTLKKTRVKAAVIPRSYPYIADASGNHPHFEWRGKGAPPRDVGYPGDVYLDLAAPHYALWARGKNGWTEWTTNSRKADLIPHPHISDRYLWCSARRPVWYSISAIKTDRCRRPFPSSVEAIREVLHNEETQSKNNMGKQGKRSRDRCESDGSEVSEVSESDEGSTVLVVSRKATRSRLDSEQGSIAGPSYTASSSLEESSQVISSHIHDAHKSDLPSLQCVDEKDVIATKRYEDLTMSEGEFDIHKHRNRN